MDVTTLISSVITGVFAVMVCIINNNTAIKRRDGEQEKKLAVIETKLENLTVEVRQHNNFAMKIPTLEANIDALKARIDKLEKN